MPTFRSRDPDDLQGKTQGIVKHRLLPKPFTLTFESRAEAVDYCERLQKSLDAGIVPEGIKQLLARGGRGDGLESLHQAVRDYEQAVALKGHDIDTLALLMRFEYSGASLGQTKLRAMTRQWAEGLVKELKLVHRLAPGTIRKRVGTVDDHRKLTHFSGV